MTNAAFEAARADGVIDTFLSMPAPRQEKAKVYDWIRKQAMDEETQTMEMPAEYMFKDVPHVEELSDPVAEVLSLMDAHGIRMMMPGVHENEHAQRACRDFPDRFAGVMSVDPNTGMEAVRKLERGVREDGAAAGHVWGTGLIPQVPIDDKKMFPLYAKCTELGVPVLLYAGVPGPRIPMAAQDVALLDEVCWYFPELKIVVRHGGEPWTELMVKLLLKWPNLYYSTSAFAPKHYPGDIVDFANTRGADKVLYAGYYSAGLGLDRIFSELPDVPFRDHVWPKFLRENAARVFGLEI
ncbi:MAG: amidohydrolase [Actinobacteria bacterium]|nr:amidohydrolase [Actinomycetota bacterium]